MTALTHEHLNDSIGSPVPCRGSYPIAASVKIYKGAQVGLNSSGQAMPANTIANGCLVIVGRSHATYDNSTGSAGVYNVEVEYGAFDWANSAGDDAIDAADVGHVCYAVDDQTVALTSGGGTRPVAGIISEYRSSRPYVLMGPGVVGAIGPSVAQLNVPLAGFFDADGDPLVKFVDGASTVPGLNLADTEAFGMRWNNHATPDPILTSIPIPQDVDDTMPMVLHILASKTGATGGDAVTFDVTAFFAVVGALHDADANCGGTSSAMTGAATAKTVQEVTLTIAAADVPAGAKVLTMTVKPTAGTLGTDDVIVEGIWFEYTRKLVTS